MDHPARIGHRRARKAPRLRIGEAREQVTPRDLRLHARQRSPEAVVNAESEGRCLRALWRWMSKWLGSSKTWGSRLPPTSMSTIVSPSPRTSPPGSSMGASAVRKLYCTGLT